MRTPPVFRSPPSTTSPTTARSSWTGSTYSGQGLDAGTRLLEVLQPADGPVLIDWTNAMAGPAAADLAMTWIVHGSVTAADAGVDDPSSFARLQRRMSESLLAYSDVAAIEAVLDDVAAWRIDDPSVSPAEATRVRAARAAFPDLPT
jgi:hypothetical protein